MISGDSMVTLPTTVHKHFSCSRASHSASHHGSTAGLRPTSRAITQPARAAQHTATGCLFAPADRHRQPPRSGGPAPSHGAHHIDRPASLLINRLCIQNRRGLARRARSTSHVAADVSLTHTHTRRLPLPLCRMPALVHTMPTSTVAWALLLSGSRARTSSP